MGPPTREIDPIQGHATQNIFPKRIYLARGRKKEVRMRRLPLLLLIILLVVPAAAASKPALYFLKDGELGPAGPGTLNGTAPDSLDPSVRPVLPGTPDLPTAEWRLTAPPAQQILGPVLLAVWPGPSAVGSGNLSATLYSVEGTTRTALASASINIDTNTSELPDPTSFIPPDPTDPESAIAHVMAQVLAMTVQPPLLLHLGTVNATIPAGQALSIGLYMEAPDGGTAPLPAGVASIEYDGQLAPSFLYVPWHVPDPDPTQTPTPTATTAPGPSTQTDTTTPGPTQTPPEGKQSPAVGLVATVAALGAAWVARRRS